MSGALGIITTYSGAKMAAGNSMMLSRRSVQMTGAASGLVASGLPSLAQTVGGVGEVRRVSAFQAHRWQDHFSNLKNGAILSDTVGRYLFFWSEDGQVEKIYPTSVPLTDELTRRGRTTITRLREGPDWRPTPSMLQRDPSLPDYVGPGPQNPLGTQPITTPA